MRFALSLGREARVTTERLLVGERGDLQLSEEQRRRWGLSSGAEFAVRETPEGLLLRRADPVLAKVYVEPTTTCNLSCRTCVRNAWSEPEGLMDMATYRHLIAGLSSVPSLRTVAFWGIGEPLLHPHIAEMVASARSLGARTELITNALLLDQAMAVELVAAGLDALIVSIDGASPETHADVRSGADLSVVRKNVESLHAIRRARSSATPQLGIEFVVMRSNAAELPNLLELAYSLGATSITVTNVLPYTEDMAEEILYWLSAEGAYTSSPSPWNPSIALPPVDTRGEMLEPLLRLLRRAGTVSAPAGRGHNGGPQCRFVGEGAVAVSWDGAVSPCVALMHSYPCYILRRRKMIRRYVLGNVAEESLPRIWEKDEYVRFRARVQEFDFAPCADCGGCHLADSNEEDCFGNPFPVCGDCLWARGVIQCP